MKIIYLILVVAYLSCTSATETPPQERIILEPVKIEANSSGGSTVTTRYSDSTITIVNLDSAGVLMDSSTIYPNPNFDGIPGELIDSSTYNNKK